MQNWKKKKKIANNLLRTQKKYFITSYLANSCLSEQKNPWKCNFNVILSRKNK